MDVSKSIDELTFSLEHTIAEDELLRAITVGLIALRQSFPSHRHLFTPPSHRHLFTPSHIHFLKSLAVISDRLRLFIELREELLDVNTLEDYAAMVSRLADIKCALAHFAVCKRVRKEIREHDDAKRRVRANARIADLEQESPHCRRHHAMVIPQLRRERVVSKFYPESRRLLHVSAQ